MSAPGLGGSETPWLQGPAKFYAHWENFSTTRDFAFCDKYNPNDAPNRQIVSGGVVTLHALANPVHAGARGLELVRHVM